MEKVEDYRDPEVLRRMYWDECMTQEEMAEALYVSRTTIEAHMNLHGIKRRGVGPRRNNPIKYWDRDVLAGYLSKGWTAKDIGQAAGRNPDTVRVYLRKYGLWTRCDRTRKYDVGGRMLTIDQMAKESGLRRGAITGRLQRGWTPAAAMSVPSLKNKKWIRGPLASKLRKEGKFEYGTYYQSLDHSDLGGHRGGNHGRC